jgi:hypothetical protein
MVSVKVSSKHTLIGDGIVVFKIENAKGSLVIALTPAA